MALSPSTSCRKKLQDGGLAGEKIVIPLKNGIKSGCRRSPGRRSGGGLCDAVEDFDGLLFCAIIVLGIIRHGDSQLQHERGFVRKPAGGDDGGSDRGGGVDRFAYRAGRLQ